MGRGSGAELRRVSKNKQGGLRYSAGICHRVCILVLGCGQVLVPAAAASTAMLQSLMVGVTTLKSHAAVADLFVTVACHTVSEMFPAPFDEACDAFSIVAGAGKKDFFTGTAFKVMDDNRMDHRRLLAARLQFFGHVCGSLGKMPYLIQNAQGEPINGLYFDGVKASSIAAALSSMLPCVAPCLPCPCSFVSPQSKGNLAAGTRDRE